MWYWSRNDRCKVAVNLVQSWCKLGAKLVQISLHQVCTSVNLVQTWCKLGAKPRNEAPETPLMLETSALGPPDVGNHYFCNVLGHLKLAPPAPPERETPTNHPPNLQAGPWCKQICTWCQLGAN